MAQRARKSEEGCHPPLAPCGRTRWWLRNSGQADGQPCFLAATSSGVAVSRANPGPALAARWPMTPPSAHVSWVGTVLAPSPTLCSWACPFLVTKALQHRAIRGAECVQQTQRAATGTKHLVLSTKAADSPAAAGPSGAGRGARCCCGGRWDALGLPRVVVGNIVWHNGKRRVLMGTRVSNQ